MNTVILIRHAQSEWNARGLFTGWANPALTDFGVLEAKRAAKTLLANGISFDCVYTSVLRRASDTAAIILQQMGMAHLPVVEDWRLNERHYGSLQGKSKEQVAEQVGAEQVWRWRRGYLDTPPPAKKQRNALECYQVIGQQSPKVESLQQTQVRALTCWEERIKPSVQKGERILLAAHGNTLRALIMALSGMTIKEVETFEIPTGIPIKLTINEAGELEQWSYMQLPSPTNTYTEHV